MTSALMKKVVNTNASEDTTKISLGEKHRSSYTRVSPTMLPVLGHSTRTSVRLSGSLFSGTTIVAVLISGLFFGLIQESSASPLIAAREDVTTTYTGVWTIDSSKFSRDLDHSAQHYYYQAIEVSVSITGTYTFTSRSPVNTYGYIYKDKFDSDDLTLNLISQDDDSDGKEQFKIIAFLHPDQRYILIATTSHPETTGEFSIISSGPTSVKLRSIIEPRIVPNIAAVDTITSYSSVYSGALSPSSPAFYRPYGDAEDYYYFQAIQVTVSTAGTYVFMSESDMDTFGYFYNSPFDPSNPLANLISADDDDGDDFLQFRIEVYLQPGRTYILVVTTHLELDTGSFSVSASGPASASLISITASTSQPIITPSTVPSISTSYSGALLSSSQVFYRPDGDTEDYYYFQAIEVTVSTAGKYIFMSTSNMDTVGYVYISTFDPSNPLVNLITEDDDDGDDIYQFRIEVYLQPGQTYILVVTTHLGSVTGSFAVSARGPASLILTSITPSTSRPIVTLSTVPTTLSSYSGALLSSSQVFYRPGGETDHYYYFQAIEVTVSTAGRYIFMSTGNMDTVGYFYSSPFDPPNPLANLITEDDDDGEDLFQFRIEAELESGRTYVLVVTTHSGPVTGNFAISARGPASVGLTSINPSTSRPIITQPTTPAVPTSYTGALTSSSPVFSRPGDTDERRFYYQAIQVTASSNGRYIFTSSSDLDTWGYFYKTSFDPSDPTVNLIADDENGGAQRQFRIQVYLQAGSTYILVVTTRREYASGNFLVTARGPASVSLTPFTASTSRPIVTPSTPTPIFSSYAGALLSSSPIFYRPQSFTNNPHYFQAIQVMVSAAGTYTFRSNSSIDTRGYFYRNSFDPSNATANLITDNDDGGGQFQFLIRVNLESGGRYVLVVTTHREYVTGNFSVSAAGPAFASLTAITPSTSRPITIESTTPSVSSSIAGELLSSSSIFYRPQSTTNNPHYFQAIQVTVSTAGTYTFRSNSSIDTRGYFYRNSFDPSNATANLIADDDDSGGQLQFRIQVPLESGGTYVLVVTTHREYATGNFSVSAAGPALVSLTVITPSTSRPITIPTTPPSVSTSYASALSSSSSIFYRPLSLTNNPHYFQAIQVTVSTAGTYSFRSNSSIDTRGYFYRTSFDPSNATANLITDNDDGGGQSQFLIQVALESGSTYVLVVTTHREYVTGNFSVTAVGPALVSLTSITPSTSRPITIPTTTPSVPSSYDGALSPSGQTFSRPGDVTARQFYFQAIQVTVSVAGSYIFRSNSALDTRGYFYRTFFNPYNSSVNLITEDDDSGGSLQFRIQVYLELGQTYILVVTTHRENITGSFSVSAGGPASLGLVPIVASTAAPTTTTTGVPSVLSAYHIVLFPSSTAFNRPDGDRKDYYYQAIQVTVSNSGTYSFTSRAFIDTIGYLYDTSFDALNPSANLIASDDNSGGNTDFRIDIALQSGRIYILVVTTSQASTVGDFWISARGPASLGLAAILPSTGITMTPPNESTPSGASTQGASSSTLGNSAAIKTSDIATATICMLVMSTVRMFQQRLF